MGFDSKGLDDYIDVAKRIAEFRTKHPEGSLQPLNPAQPFDIRELAGADKNGKEVRGTFIIYTAAAYRSPDDKRPGVGCAYEVFPGRTPYTAGSELQNAETAAWGRAIVAALAADTRAGVSSQQEVRNRQAERDQPAGDVFEKAAPTAKPRYAERMASVPADDPWYGDAPPATDGSEAKQAQPRPRVTRPEATETDQVWLDLMGQEIAQIKTREDGAKAWASIAKAFKGNTCTAADRKALEGLVAGRVSGIVAEEHNEKSAA